MFVKRLKWNCYLFLSGELDVGIDVEQTMSSQLISSWQGEANLKRKEEERMGEGKRVSKKTASGVRSLHLPPRFQTESRHCRRLVVNTPSFTQRVIDCLCRCSKNCGAKNRHVLWYNFCESFQSFQSLQLLFTTAKNYHE